jgi:hypothetical protein
MGTIHRNDTANPAPVCRYAVACRYPIAGDHAEQSADGIGRSVQAGSRHGVPALELP